MAKEKNLTAVTSVAAADFARVVTSAGASVKATFANVAKYIIETYNGSTVAGSAQSVKSALDSLNSNTEGEITSSHTLLSGQCKLSKVGKVVTLTMGMQFTSAVGNYSSIATLPSGYRPVAQVWGSVRNFDFDITAGGNVRAITSMSSGSSVNISMTYVVPQGSFLNSKIVAERVLKSSGLPEIPANTSIRVEIDTSKSGYTPIGIIEVTGSGNNGLLVQDFYLQGATANLYFRNVTSSAKTAASITIGVLYMKN